MEKYTNKLTQEYENNLIGELQSILKIFPATQRLSASLNQKKIQMRTRRQYYEQLKRASRRVHTNYKELAEVISIYLHPCTKHS